MVVLVVQFFLSAGVMMLPVLTKLLPAQLKVLPCETFSQTEQIIADLS